MSVIKICFILCVTMRSCNNQLKKNIPGTFNCFHVAIYGIIRSSLTNVLNILSLIKENCYSWAFDGSDVVKWVEIKKKRLYGENGRNIKCLDKREC